TTQTYSMGDVLAGKTATKTFLFGPVASSPATLTVTVDPGTPGAVLECREAVNAKACGSTTGQRQVNIQACPNSCSTTAEAGSDATICEGQPLTVDGRNSIANCLTVGPIEYQWKVDGTIVPGCTFSGTPTCTIPASMLLS